MERRLYRSQHNRILLGVCGGLGEYFNIDPVIVRVIAVVLVLATWVVPGLIAYFIMALIVPLAGSTAATPNESMKENADDIKNTAANIGGQFKSTFAANEARKNTEEVPPTVPQRSASNNAAVILAVVLISIGALILAGTVLGWFFRYFWPALLILGGIIIILVVRRRQKS